MKRAKMLLSAIAVMAVVGTSLAFTAHKYSSKRLWTGTTSTSCSYVEGKTTTINSTDAKVYVATTGVLNGTTTSCPLFTYTITIDND